MWPFITVHRAFRLSEPLLSDLSQRHHRSIRFQNKTGLWRLSISGLSFSIWCVWNSKKWCDKGHRAVRRDATQAHITLTSDRALPQSYWRWDCSITTWLKMTQTMNLWLISLSNCPTGLQGIPICKIISENFLWHYKMQLNSNFQSGERL